MPVLASVYQEIKTIKSLLLLSILATSLVQAEPIKDEADIDNYQQCMFSECVQKKAPAKKRAFGKKGMQLEVLGGTAEALIR